MLKQAPAVFHRIDAGGMGQLVDSAFYRRKIARRPDSAPDGRQHALRGLMADLFGIAQGVSAPAMMSRSMPSRVKAGSQRAMTLL